MSIIEKLSRYEIYFHPSANPNYSVMRVVITKLRILLEWLSRRISEAGTRRKALNSMRALKESQVGRHALVMANGPSLNLMSFEKVSISQETCTDVFAVNFFPVASKTTVMTPNFLVLSDPITKPTSQNVGTMSLWDWIGAHANVRIICPSSWYRMALKSQIDFSRFIFFDDTSLISWSQNISPVRARSYLSLTAYKALAASVYMGYTEIDIVGFDNNQVKGLSVNDKNRVIQGPSHFTQYCEDADLTDQLAGGVADYFYDFSCAFLHLRKFSKLGNIWNLDPNSYVDAFPKKMNSELLENV